jgi:hypothetical protein
MRTYNCRFAKLQVTDFAGKFFYHVNAWHCPDTACLAPSVSFYPVPSFKGCYRTLAGYQYIFSYALAAAYLQHRQITSSMSVVTLCQQALYATETVP